MPFSTLLIRIGLILVILFLLDFYVFNGIKTAAAGIESERTRKIIYWAFWGFTSIYLLVFIFGLFVFDSSVGPRGALFRWLAALLVLVWLPKIIFALFLLTEDVFRLLEAASVFIFDKTGWKPKGDNVSYFHARRKLLSQIGLAVAAVPFTAVLYGITKGKYHFKVHEVTLFFKDLPKSFDGFTLTQISDVHSGSFDNAEEVSRGIQLINDQKSDVVLFTGDLVNNTADEFYPWIDLFKKIEAPLGKYSVVGNHDYGDYIPWKTPQAKRENFMNLMKNHSQIGFRLLLNENIVFTRDNEKIALVGVENWGLPPFPQKGDLNKAVEKIDDNIFKILMSHDPSHWDAQVLKQKNKIHLTLSGHTHGMQFGVEIPGFIKWSPVKFKYPRWADLYQQGDQYLYVNRGFGFIGFPGRVGIWPEITKITLKSA